MMAYKILTSLIGVLRHDFTTFGYLLFTNQYLAISEAVLDNLSVNSFPNCRKSSPNIYGFCLQRGMGYGLLRLYGLWSIFPCEPTRWTEKPMGLKGVWGNWAMGYEGVDCISKTAIKGKAKIAVLGNPDLCPDKNWTQIRHSDRNFPKLSG